ncbi:MAG: methylmalonyl-CoA epimerase [Planctomycetes bacterium]|nr:methylmalonyl-CoA epimerase [Planctomycetota bacterium]
MKGLDHIGVAVESLEEALRVWRGGLGLEVEHEEEVPAERVRVARLGLPGAGAVELLESTSPEGPVGRFLRRNGPGLHHLALRVEDLDAALAAARDAGLSPVGEAPRAGVGGTRVAFLHPRDTGGVLLELVERAAPGVDPGTPAASGHMEF